MDIIGIIANVRLAISAAQAAYQLGQDARPFIQNAADIIGGKTLSIEERAAMLDMEKRLRDRLQAPIND